jgi:hypothetical protein
MRLKTLDLLQTMVQQTVSLKTIEQQQHEILMRLKTLEQLPALIEMIVWNTIAAYHENEVQGPSSSSSTTIQASSSPTMQDEGEPQKEKEN